MRITNATLPDGKRADIRIEGGNIVAVGTDLDPVPREGTIDATGLRALPGAIDVHVHLREPGYEHKETWASGTASAAAGGVTTVVDQPNTEPPTVDGASFEQKCELAGAAHVDFGINGGVVPDWDPEALLSRPIFALGEVFLADSTGEMGIDEDLFATALEVAADADVTVTIHAEDATEFDEGAKSRDDPAAWSAFRRPAAEVSAVERAIEINESIGADLHLAHASVPEAVDIAVEAGITCEVTPHHLLLSEADLPELGTFGRMNPPLRRESAREGMWERLLDGTIDMVATDHAPHTREEKDADIWDAPSGVPGVETMLPLLAAAAERGEIAYDRIATATARRPAERFSLPKKGRLEAGMDADLVLLDSEPRQIAANSLQTACDWTPYEGEDGVFPVLTIVRGRVVAEEGDVGPAVGTNVRDRPGAE